MTALNLIAHDIPSLSVTQTGKDAFHLLNDHHVRHLPVVSAEGQLLGILSEEDIFNHKLYEPIGDYNFSLLRRFAVREREHVFEVMRLMGDNRLTIIPVIDDAEHYVGLITQNDLLRYFAAAASFSELGAVLVLDLPRRDYSLAALARIVEDESAKILSAFVTSSPNDEDNVEVTLKLNRQDAQRIIASLQRHEFEVKEAFGEEDYSDTLKEHYESLMNYLNV